MGKSFMFQAPKITFHVSSPRCFGSLVLDRKLPRKGFCLWRRPKNISLLVYFADSSFNDFSNHIVCAVLPCSFVPTWAYIYFFLEIMKYCISLSAHCLNFWAPFLGCLRRGSIFFHGLLWPQGYAYLNYIHCDEASFSRLDQSLDLFRSVLKWFGIRSNVDPGCC